MPLPTTYTDRWVVFAPDGTLAEEHTFDVADGQVTLDHDLLVSLLSRTGMSQSALPDDDEGDEQEEPAP